MHEKHVRATGLIGISDRRQAPFGSVCHRFPVRAFAPAMVVKVDLDRPELAVLRPVPRTLFHHRTAAASRKARTSSSRKATRLVPAMGTGGASLPLRTSL